MHTVYGKQYYNVIHSLCVSLTYRPVIYKLQVLSVPLVSCCHVLFLVLSLSLFLPLPSSPSLSSQPYLNTVSPAPLLKMTLVAYVLKNALQMATALVDNSAAPMGVVTPVLRPYASPTTPHQPTACALQSMMTWQELVKNVVITTRTVALVKCAVPTVVVMCV